MSKKMHDTSLMARVMAGQVSRRDFMREAGTLAAMPVALKGTLLAAGGAAAAVAPAAISATAQDGAVMLTANNEQQATWIRNFNPLLPENASCRWPTLFGIYEPLFVWNTIKAETVPWLAKEWSFSDDNLVLTMTVQDGVMWSDGELFTANDVAFTWNLLKDNEALPGNGARGPMPYLESIEATDDATVVFTFNEVFTIAQYEIGGQVIVPEHIFSTVEDPVTYTNEEPVGTGPFTEVNRFEAQIFELGANPNYWQEGKPSIPGIRLPTFPSKRCNTVGRH
jgi:peptide/nickel transport system substrate-binding protein